jgi:hypothetical protein
MDLWVRPAAGNGVRVLSALAEYGTPLEQLTADRFENPRTLLILGRDPFRVDILTDLAGITFEEAWRTRVSVVLEGVQIPLIGKPELIKNKRAVGRLQDLADVEELEKVDEA